MQYKPFVQGCHKRTKCGRALKDNFVSPAVVDALRGIADHGMQGRSTLGGPTIMDINTGYVKDGNGLINLYRQDPPVQFTTAHTIEVIRRAIMHEFQLTTLYFTAPTFLTRLIGNASWTPAELHDEYWSDCAYEPHTPRGFDVSMSRHAHVDKNNTHHYDYSGLLYLADYGVEFTGGMFAFLDHHRNTTVEPARVFGVDALSGRPIASAAGTVVPPDMRCRYKTGRCPLARATKRSGRPLLLCEFHRAKQNSIKRKSDTKYRIDRQKARDAMDRPLQTQAQLPVDFDKCLLLSNPLHIPIVPLAHDPLTPLQQLISPTSDMGGDDIALLQFFVLTPR
ncbi:hypothetical protein DYB32_009305 [Aphanomyces invadans]|uniref:Uncharacterized protein n=1 Tax=Aphanomyces invadans TaxID=157072 RepID=A0A418AIP5_9STRA|nr:hypothetical protein DYB32_009305 [Aphanomyces invadans]